MSVQASPAIGYADPSRTVRSGRARNRNGVSAVLGRLAPLIGVVAFLGLWELAVKVFDVKPFVLPAPLKILQHINSAKSFYWSNARTTLWEAFLGFAIAFGAALLIASIIAQLRFLERAVMPLVVLVQVTPLIAYAPAIVIWLGFGIKPIVMMTALVCFVPFLINGVTGLRSVDPNLLELARSVDATRREVFFRLRLPSALPHLFSAARIAVGLALIGAVLGEFFAGVRHGLGYAVKIAQSRSLTLQLWGAIFVLALIGALAIALISGLERLALRWHASQRT